MQLVLGARIGTGLGAAGAPLPAPPERWRLSERARRILRRVVWGLAFAALAALGGLHGASLAIGADGVSELAKPSAAAATEPDAAREADGVRGAFWRPERSNAQRPPARVAPRRWQPE